MHELHFRHAFPQQERKTHVDQKKRKFVRFFSLSTEYTQQDHTTIMGTKKRRNTSRVSRFQCGQGNGLLIISRKRRTCYKCKTKTIQTQTLHQKNICKKKKKQNVKKTQNVTSPKKGAKKQMQKQKHVNTKNVSKNAK